VADTPPLLVDVASFVVMRRLDLPHAFAFDRESTKQGFKVVR